MPEESIFDLNEYHANIAQSLAARLSETAYFIRSVDMAISNFPKGNVKDESILMSIPLPPFNQNDPTPLPHTANTATRLAVIEMIGALEEALRASWLLLRAAEKSVKKHHYVHYLELNGLMSEESRALKRLGFGQVLHGINKHLTSLNLLPQTKSFKTAEDKLLKYVKFRNCIAHRLGTVEDKDLGISEERLVIKRRVIEFYIDEERIIRHPMTRQGISEVKMVRGTRTLSWKLGEKIDIKPEEGQEVAVDLYLCFQNYTNPLMGATALYWNSANEVNRNITNNKIQNADVNE